MVDGVRHWKVVVLLTINFFYEIAGDCLILPRIHEPKVIIVIDLSCRRSVLRSGILDFFKFKGQGDG